MEATPIAPAVVIAALIVRTGLDELRHPGTARHYWAFIHDRRAQGAGIGIGAIATSLAWPDTGWAAPAWAVLISLLVAFLIGRQGASPPTPGEGSRQMPIAGTVLALFGAVLVLAGAMLYVLPGPGLPLLAVGCPLLVVGLVLSAAQRHWRKR
ncbi:hypothetical protein ACFW3D_29820 [Streptomyces sp. NPDC058864]